MSKKSPRRERLTIRMDRKRLVPTLRVGTSFAGAKDLPPTPTKKSSARQGFEDASPTTQRLILHWNSLPNTPTHNLEVKSKTIHSVIKVLDGGLVDKYGEETIALTMDNYHYLYSTNGNRLPRLTLERFFVLSKYEKERLLQRNGKSTKPMFFKLVKPGGTTEYIKDNRYPETVAILKEFYEEFVLGEERQVPYSIKDENNFINAAKKLERYMRGGRLDKYLVDPGPREYTQFLFKALGDCWGFEGISPGNLASDHTYREVLPKYISKYGRSLGEEERDPVTDPSQWIATREKPEGW
jgi:hypothetical protein